MLYFLFLYRSDSGILLYDKDFQVKDKKHMDMFGSFYTALKAFISGVMSDKKDELKTVGLGEVNAYISQIPELSIDLILIADKEDSKNISKLNPKITALMLQYKDLFEENQVNRDLFENFNKDINEIMLSQKGILDPNFIIEKRGDILKSIWDQKGEISIKIKDEIERLRIERDELIKNFEKEIILLKKLEKCQDIINISEKLLDKNTLVEFQKSAKTLINEIEERKAKLRYYLSQAKESLNLVLAKGSVTHGQYKEVYSYLYSFSSKLKNLVEREIYHKYYELANKFINVDKFNHEELLMMINEVLEMDNNIDNYIFS
ncbi:MAG: hypothetical protein ACFFDL_00280 [Promethearchaeota archaeon]